jgi:serine protease Do
MSTATKFLALTAFVALAPLAAPPALAGEIPAGDEASQPALRPEVLQLVKKATVFVQAAGAAAGRRLDPEGTESSGSGFFIAPDGRAVTNWHVVAPILGVGPDPAARSREIQVIVGSGARDQKVLPARLLAVDVESDLAVLKVEAEGCAALAIGDSGKLVETSPVWVAGFPLGRIFSVLQRGPELAINSGHVSSLRHNDLGRLEQVQFDAAVVPGNSGGPVFAPDGRVVGVASAALGTSRVNFAVPAERIKRLLEDCPLDRKVGKDCAVEITSEPAGAEVYLDSVLLGKTPLNAKVEGGYRQLVVAAPERRAWARGLCVYDGRKLAAGLEPLTVTSLKLSGGDAGPAAAGAAMKPGAAIYTQDFADAKAADAWDQDTGGSGRERSWYVQDGALHQFSDDGMLHAIFAGERDWTDYSFSARVRIGDNQKDGRAGLIFRSTDDGFALFRLHRGTSRVHLAYHGTRPFGWQVFEDRTLPFKVKAETWYKLEVQVHRDQIVCLIDGKVVLEATAAGRPLKGRVGFYSVDAQASFDDAEVKKLEPGERADRPAAGLKSFWFTETFMEDHGFWRAYRKGADAAPWKFLPGACRPGDPKAEGAVNLLARYDVHDFAAGCAVTARSGTVGLVFRRDGDRHYLLTVEPAAGRCRLLLVEKDKQKELAASEDAEAVKRALSPGAADDAEEDAPVRRRGGTGVFTIFVSAQGGQLRGGINGTALVEADDGTLTHGQLGLYADGAEAAFHRLDVNAGGR